MDLITEAEETERRYKITYSYSWQFKYIYPHLLVVGLEAGTSHMLSRLPIAFIVLTYVYTYLLTH